MSSVTDKLVIMLTPYPPPTPPLHLPFPPQRPDQPIIIRLNPLFTGRGKPSRHSRNVTDFNSDVDHDHEGVHSSVAVRLDALQHPAFLLCGNARSFHFGPQQRVGTKGSVSYVFVRLSLLCLRHASLVRLSVCFSFPCLSVFP